MSTGKKGYKGGEKIALLFSGGPAPSANAVISASALTFLNAGHSVIGFYKGFEFLQAYEQHNPYSLVEGLHFKRLGLELTKWRTQTGVLLKTSRANPGKTICGPQDLADESKTKQLHNILHAFETLGIGFLVTIGGDDTLKTGNYLRLLGMPVIHIPKTIDNDYYGIPWTFGYWTAVHEAGKAIRNLNADAKATDAFFVVELMGRKAGWLTYAAGIVGEAVRMISTEDIPEQVDLDKLCDELAQLIIMRERMFKPYGIICISEGLADKLPDDKKPKETDRHGNIIYGKAVVCNIIARGVADRYKNLTGKKKRIKGKQIGYETRCAAPISFDVLLGAMLGFGSYKLFSQDKFGHMVSVSENFDITGIPFQQLIDEKTLVTRLRNVPKGSDFYDLKEALSFRILD